METKFKLDYQKKTITSNRIKELGARYLHLWFYIFALYLYLDTYTNIIDEVIINDKTLPILDLIIYSFLVAWLIPFSIVFFKDIDVWNERKKLQSKIRNQRKKISNYESNFSEGGLQTRKVSRKLVKLNNKLIFLKTKLDMMGFMEVPEDD